MNKTATLSTPRLVGAFVLALGLLVAGLAVGLGPAGAVMDSGGEEPSVTELNWSCDEDGLCHCNGRPGGRGADCRALQDANPDCEGWMELSPGVMWCAIPDGEPIFHPDGTEVAPNPEDDPTLPIGPGDLPGAENPGGSTIDPNPETGGGPIGPGDLPGAENPEAPTEPEQPENPGTPEPPETPEQPPTGPPPGIDPGKVLDPGDLPGTVDPGPRSGSADSGKGLDLPGVMS